MKIGSLKYMVWKNKIRAELACFVVLYGFFSFYQLSPLALISWATVLLLFDINRYMKQNVIILLDITFLQSHWCNRKSNMEKKVVGFGFQYKIVKTANKRGENYYYQKQIGISYIPVPFRNYDHEIYLFLNENNKSQLKSTVIYYARARVCVCVNIVHC